MSSCCGGKCGCGSGCSCGSNCNGCGKYPDLSYTESTTSVTLIMGVAPTEKPKDKKLLRKKIKIELKSMDLDLWSKRTLRFKKNTWRDSKMAWKPGTTAAAIAEITARAIHASVLRSLSPPASEDLIVSLISDSSCSGRGTPDISLSRIPPDLPSQRRDRELRSLSPPASEALIVSLISDLSCSDRGTPDRSIRYLSPPASEAPILVAPVVQLQIAQLQTASINFSSPSTSATRRSAEHPSASSRPRPREIDTAGLTAIVKTLKL
ncbi:hypothetical protein TIFTF001_027829 [Ficus carica]|uniref:Metallothionein-like protein n=1 Tax=Ficus carica TaxID=3494 RepID=A0AA88J0B0_FICCA|nr:hypothetical protein TIFTF001_027829 [Ficus carica]